MKKFKLAGVVAIVAALAILAPMARNTTTPAATVVTAVQRTAGGFASEVNGDIVTVETEDGHIWDFYGDGYAAGNFVEVVFDTNGTPDNVVDDAILQVNCA